MKLQFLNVTSKIKEKKIHTSRRRLPYKYSRKGEKKFHLNINYNMSRAMLTGQSIESSTQFYFLKVRNIYRTN